MSKAASLEQIQRWMQSVIMHPGEVKEGVESPAARQHIDIGAEELESVILRSRALDSSARLEIYVDAYFERLLECLREEFVATRTAVGVDLFNALAFGYLQHYPSRSYTLNTLGAKFAKYLAESRLHAHEVPDGAPSSWPEFVIELATFERDLRDVFDGPGNEGRGVLDFSELSQITPEQWSATRLTMAPCVRLVQFNHPVHVYWNGSKAGETSPPPELGPTRLVISRRAYVVERRELSPHQYELLRHVVAGETLSQAIASTSHLPNVDCQSLEVDVQTWFAEWTAAGFFLGLLIGEC